MKIEKNKIVSLDFELYNDKNQLLDKMQEIPIKYLHGKYDDIFRKVEETLDGKKINDEIDIYLTPDEAFGNENSALIQIEPLDKLSKEIGAENIALGMVLEASSPDYEETILYRITDIEDNSVVLDANHPLAGEKIRFKAKIIDISDATDEQIAFGSANIADHNHNHDDDHHHHH